MQKYFTDNFVFKNPEFDLKHINLNTKRIIFINKEKENKNKFIPCLFIQEYEQRSKFLIFFHGNNDDIFSSELVGQWISEYLNMNVIIVEYPGYSIYYEEKSADIICEDAKLVYDFIIKTFELKQEDIYVLGRSLGTGPAVYLASQKNINSLFLISPFKKINDIYWWFSKILLLDIFKSIDIIKNIKCLTFIIHGEKDNIINVNHSKELIKILKNINPNNNAIYPPNMTHNEMDFKIDILDKISNFISQNNLYSNVRNNYFSLKDKKFDSLFEIPISIQKFLIIKNLQLTQPIIIEKEARCSLLLNDERVAFGTDDLKILIHDIDEDEIQISIDTKNIGQINFLIQLKNNILVGYTDFYIGFYILKRFKYTELTKIYSEKRIIKVEEGNNNNLFVLTVISIIVYNICDNKITLIKEIQNQYDYNNFIFLSPYILANNKENTFILNYEEEKKNISKLKEYSLKSIQTNKNIIQINNSIIGILCKHTFQYINLNDFSTYSYEHNIDNPDYIYRLSENINAIGNKEGMNIFFTDQEKENSSIKKLNCFEYKNITSIIGLKNGRIIITKSKNNDINKLENNQECSIY